MKVAQAAPATPQHGWILHNNTEIHELKRVADEAAKANVQLELINPKDIELLLSNKNDGTIYVNGEKRELPEFAVAAFLNEMDYYNLAVLRQLNVKLYDLTAQELLHYIEKEYLAMYQ